MKILSINKYYALRGGADREMFNLERMLVHHGHVVAPFGIDLPETLPTPYRKYFIQARNWNERSKFSLKQQIEGFINIIYNFEAKQKVTSLICDFKPDVAHIHNIHYDISPSVIDSLRSLKIPVVMHLHDSRIFCPNGYMFTQHHYCERCLFHKYYHAALHNCLKNDWKGSLAASVANYVHRWMKVWTRKVDRYIVPTEIVRDLAVRAGIDAGKIDVYTYPAPLDSIKPSLTYENFILFFGYHVEQKGIFNLIEAMTHIKTNIRLKMCGKGPETPRLEKMIREKGLTNIELLGFIPDEELFELLSRCLFVVLPSIGFENSNALIREANSAGKAVLGSRRGGIPELIVDGETGRIFNSTNVLELAAIIDQLAEDREGTIRLGKNGRALVEKKCTEQLYYQNIMKTYRQAGVNCL
jgi:glycosyltransferase involved in cell wall biosynthesis